MAQIVRKVVSEQLLKLLPQSHITITEVDISDDLRYADLYVSSFSTDERVRAALLEEIDHYRRDLQHELNHQVETKFTPQLRFHRDRGQSHADRVDQLLDDLS